MSVNRAFLLILDGFGVGEAPDAAKFGDEGADTFGHLLDRFPDWRIPNLAQLGLKELKSRSSDDYALRGEAQYGRMKELSAGKDTTSGHWEMMGTVVEKAFDVFPQGFPSELVEKFCERAGLSGVLGNCPASGTEILKSLGEAHQQSGQPILYTSADSVWQLAAHEESFGRERLYEICQIARELLDESPYQVGRVIARPFVGDSAENYQRSVFRRDYSLVPPEVLFTDHLKEEGFDVIGVGKVPSIFAHRGFTEELEGKTDEEAWEAALERWKRPFRGLIFVNLNELDSLYAHRRNPEAYARHLETIDQKLGEFLPQLGNEEILLITADHGNDPSFTGSDHTREWVPWLSYRADRTARRAAVGDKEGFATVSESLSRAFGLAKTWSADHVDL